MDAAAKRREARRQKILARGTNRMDKIMGISTDEGEQEREPIADPFVVDSMRRPSQEDLLVRGNLVTSNHIDSVYDEPATPEPVPELVEEPYRQVEQPYRPVEEPRPIRRRDPIRTHAPVIANNAPAPETPSLPPQLANLLSSLQAQDLPQDELADQVKQTDNKTFYRVRILLCLVIGVLVRLSFLFQIGPDYVQTAINPFVAFEVAVIGYQRAVGMGLSANVKGGLWLSALALSGFKPDTITKYKQVVGITSALLEDFTMYFFAFTVTHIFV